MGFVLRGKQALAYAKRGHRLWVCGVHYAVLGPPMLDLSGNVVVDARNSSGHRTHSLGYE